MLANISCLIFCNKVTGKRANIDACRHAFNALRCNIFLHIIHHIHAFEKQISESNSRIKMSLLQSSSRLEELRQKQYLSSNEWPPKHKHLSHQRFIARLPRPSDEHS
jgi:hypothetical protein